MRLIGASIVGFCAVLLMFAAICGPASALTADEVLKGASERYDKFTSSVKDLTIEQEMTVVQGQMKTQMKMMRKGAKYRVESTTSTPPSSEGAQRPPMTTTMIFDGKDTWIVSPFAGKRRLEADEALGRGPELSWTERLKGRLVLLGEEKVADRNAWVIEVKQDEKSPAGPEPFSKVWIDTGNYWMLKAQSKMPNGIAESRFSDFRKVQGDFSMPFLHEVFIDGVLQSKSVTKSIKTNSGLSDDLFDTSKVKSEGPSLEDMIKQSRQGK